VHTGEVQQDDYGVAGAAINLAFRLLEARPLKEALRGSSDTLALITSEWFYQEVVRRHPNSVPKAYRQMPVRAKETRTHAWSRLPDSLPPVWGQVGPGLRTSLQGGAQDGHPSGLWMPGRAACPTPASRRGPGLRRPGGGTGHPRRPAHAEPGHRRRHGDLVDHRYRRGREDGVGGEGRASRTAPVPRRPAVRGPAEIRCRADDLAGTGAGRDVACPRHAVAADHCGTGCAVGAVPVATGRPPHADRA
jgi:hypothetical protein